MIVDIHAHLWSDPAAQAKRQAAAGVDTTVLLATRFHPEAAHTLPELRHEFERLLGGLAGAPTGDAYERSTEELFAALPTYPGNAVAMTGAPMGSSDEVRDVLERRLTDPRVVAIGEISPAGGQAAQLEPFLQVAADHEHIPVLAHGFAPNTAADIRTYADLAQRYPRVPLIVGAFGGMSSMTLIELATERPNLFLDLSSALQVFMVRAAASSVPDQCLFGSNSPYGDPLASRTTIEAAVSDTHVRDQVLGNNAAALFGLA